MAGDFTYTTNSDNTINITGYTGTGGAIDIPSAIEEKTVATIEFAAFQYLDSMTSVTIPASVTNIGDLAFSYCASLTAILVDAGNAVYCNSADGVLFNKSRTTLIQCPGGKAGSYTITNSVTTLGDAAFGACTGLTSVTIPDSVTDIRRSVFDACRNLSSVIIPASVASIGDYAFYYCRANLTGVYFHGNAPIIGSSVFDGDDNATVYYLAGTTGWGATFGDRPTALWPGQASITTQPRSLTKKPGFSANFTVVASGAAPLYYQWQKDSVNIVSANSATYTINPVAIGNSGNYRCIVSNIINTVTSVVVTLTVNTTPSDSVINDYDGDGESDLAVYGDGYWNIYSLTNGSILLSGKWGGAGWTAAPGDYDGDGESDLAVYGGGYWNIYSLTNGSILLNGKWGGAGWTAVPGDYDGDGESDLAVYGGGYWNIYSLANGSILLNGKWGGPGWAPVAGDYDGDGEADLAVYNDGYWNIYSLANGSILLGGKWGGAGWTTAPGDYDGDGESDLAVYGNGYWYIYSLANGSILLNGKWGGPGWITVPGDYDGDGESDLAVYGDGYWYIYSLANGSILLNGKWGGPGWTPVK